MCGMIKDYDKVIHGNYAIRPIVQLVTIYFTKHHAISLMQYIFITVAIMLEQEG